MGCIFSSTNLEIDGITYCVGNKIADGGFSEVFLCQVEKSRKEFVLKNIRCHSSDDISKAVAEAKYHQRIDHKNVLACIGFLIADTVHSSSGPMNVVHLLFPYHRRGTLANELELCQISQTHLSMQRIGTTMSGVIDGLQAMHALDLAHRDLKTANILLTEDLQPVLMDLGSVTDKVITVSTPSEASKWQDFAAENCSITYRAPELFQVNFPSKITEKADIWSLGCVLYTMCFYESPFDKIYCRGDSVSLAVTSGITAFPESSNNFPKELMDLIRRVCSPCPDNRPSLQDISDCIAQMYLPDQTDTDDVKVTFASDAV